MQQRSFFARFPRPSVFAGEGIYRMDTVIKNMETDAEIRGKAYVHWKSWHETYPGLIDGDYLNALTLEKCENAAFRWRDNAIIAKDGGRVIGFATCGECRDEDVENAGEVVAIYLLSEYHGKGVGAKLMRAALERLPQKRIVVRVLKGNSRAIRFYKKFGFRFDGYENAVRPGIAATELRMVLERVSIEEIPVENAEEFWKLHIKYLVEDGIITDKEDIEYFSGEDYRGVIIGHMKRAEDKHRMVYFIADGKRVGAAQYNTYRSEDGKCFILDFWVFPEFRGDGMGRRCFYALEEYAKADGAKYFELNSEKEDSVRFWKSLGFLPNGRDEYGMPLFERRV